MEHLIETETLSESERLKLAELNEVCRGTGLKLTRQRVEIMRELAKAKDHPSVETVYQRVKGRLPGVSLDTVYRTLGTFERLQLVDKLNVAQEHSRYDADRSPHHHLACRVCKAIEDFTWEELEALPLPPDVQIWGHPEARHVVVSGVCRHCKAAEPSLS